MTRQLIEQILWQNADRFNELHEPGSRFLYQNTEVKTIGWAFVCGGSLLIRVSGVVGAVPVDCLALAADQWEERRCENPTCRGRLIDGLGFAVRVIKNRQSKVECSECFNR